MASLGLDGASKLLETAAAAACHELPGESLAAEQASHLVLAAACTELHWMEWVREPLGGETAAAEELDLVVEMPQAVVDTAVAQVQLMMSVAQAVLLLALETTLGPVKVWKAEGLVQQQGWH